MNREVCIAIEIRGNLTYQGNLACPKDAKEENFICKQFFAALLCNSPGVGALSV